MFIEGEHAMKIAIVGYSGSGKSTLARRLGDLHKVDVLHFDTVQFLPGWEVRGAEEKERMVSEFLDSHDSWVIDGNYSKLFFERRMEEADLIILLLFNRFACLNRVVKRYRMFKNQNRPDMADGCIEKLDAEFIRWVLFEGRTKRTRERYEGLLDQYPQKTVVLRDQRQLDSWLKRRMPSGLSI